MTIVIDASVIVAALSDTGRYGNWAEALIASEILASPELAMVEATNILRRPRACQRTYVGGIRSGTERFDAPGYPVISNPSVCRTRMGITEKHHELRCLVCGTG